MSHSGNHNESLSAGNCRVPVSFPACQYLERCNWTIRFLDVHREEGVLTAKASTLYNINESKREFYLMEYIYSCLQSLSKMSCTRCQWLFTKIHYQFGMSILTKAKKEDFPNESGSTHYFAEIPKLINLVGVILTKRKPWCDFLVLLHKIWRVMFEFGFWQSRLSSHFVFSFSLPLWHLAKLENWEMIVHYDPETCPQKLIDKWIKASDLSPFRGIC